MPALDYTSAVRSLPRAGLVIAAVTLVIAAFAYEWLPLLAVGLLGVLILVFLVQDEIAFLMFVLVGFAAVSGYQAGFQITEVLYGLIYLSYIAFWLLSRTLIQRERIAPLPGDKALLIFMAWVTACLPLTIVFNGQLPVMASEWLSLSMLGLYFPIRAICERDDRAVPVLLAAVAFVALFVVARNMREYWIGLHDASYLWQIMTGRVRVNEHIVMFSGLVSLSLFATSRTRQQTWLSIPAFLLFSGGLVLGQSRAVWVAYFIGIVVLLLGSSWPARRRLVMMLLSFFVVAVAFLALFLEGFLDLIRVGLVERAASISTAAATDVSLINRFRESATVMALIAKNPIVGYGLGVPFDYHSLVYELQHQTTYVHNTFVGVWYKHGLIGLTLIGFFYIYSCWISFRLSRTPHAPRHVRAIGLGILAGLAAEAVAANADNSLATSDKTYIIGVCCAVVSGLYVRYGRDLRSDVARST